MSEMSVLRVSLSGVYFILFYISIKFKEINKWMNDIYYYLTLYKIENWYWTSTLNIRRIEIEIELEIEIEIRILLFDNCWYQSINQINQITQCYMSIVQWFVCLFVCPQYYNVSQFIQNKKTSSIEIFLHKPFTALVIWGCILFFLISF